MSSGTSNEGKGDAVTGHVYFARCGDLIKIGYATHLAIRRSLFRRWAIDLVAAFPGSREDAWQLHQRFAAYRIGKQNGAEPGRPQFFTLPDNVIEEIVATYGSVQSPKSLSRWWRPRSFGLSL